MSAYQPQSDLVPERRPIQEYWFDDLGPIRVSKNDNAGTKRCDGHANMASPEIHHNESLGSGVSV